MTDDQRAAVTVLVGLINQLTTTALGLIAVQAAFLVFVLNNHDVSIWPFGVLVSGTFISLLSSVVMGAVGIDDTATQVADSAWRQTTAKRKFQAQTILQIAGILFFLSSLLFNGTPKED